MANLTHGKVTIAIPKELELPAEAGKLSAAEIQRLPKAPKGLGTACEQAAAALEKVGKQLTVPPALTAKALREAGQRAEGMDDLIHDIDVLRATIQQANLIRDEQAWSLLRQLKDQVAAQGKVDKSLLPLFQPLLDYVAKPSIKAAATRRAKPKPTPAP